MSDRKATSDCCHMLTWLTGAHQSLKSWFQFLQLGLCSVSGMNNTSVGGLDFYMRGTTFSFKREGREAKANPFSALLNLILFPENVQGKDLNECSAKIFLMNLFPWGIQQEAAIFKDRSHLKNNRSLCELWLDRSNVYFLLIWLYFGQLGNGHEMWIILVYTVFLNLIRCGFFSVLNQHLATSTILTYEMY